MDRRHLLAGGAATAAAMPFLSPAQAQQAMDEAKMPALMGGNFALMTSQLAAERATDEAIKTFAQLEIAEQEATARAFGAEPGAGGVSEQHQALIDQLTGLEGAEFDRAYVQGQIAGHEELRAIHADYAENGQDPMARGASMVGVPSIDTHLSILNGMAQRLG